MFEEIVGESKGLSKEYKGNQSRDTSFLFESRDTSLRVEAMRPFIEGIHGASRRQVCLLCSDSYMLFESRDTSLRVEVMRPFTERIPDAARRQVSIRQAPHSA